jgi:electron transfer flavoprotein alpha subunit
MSNKILVFAEQRDGNIKKSSFEAISEGKRLAEQLGGEVIGGIIGSGIENIAGTLAHYGANKVLISDDPQLKTYSTEGYTTAFTEMIKKEQPSVVLISASAMGKDLAPRVAQKIGAGLASDCTKIEIEQGRLLITRPMYAGKVYAKVVIKTDPQMATLRPNVFPALPADTSKSASIEKISVSGLNIKAKVKEIVASSGGKVDLTEASIIVSGGRGMKGPENFKMLEELADVLGGVVGASRAVVDAGWRPHEDQVGQTGKVVSPNLYIACGISGAIQHLAGMSSSKCIVAINKDPDAPIFKVADYGIVGDIFEIIPQFTQEAKKLLGK